MDINLRLHPGMVTAIIGENGAGKSTLMKLLSGAYVPTAGTIHIEGQPYQTLDPELSQQLGIEIVYQENDLVPCMNAVENIFVGKELTLPFGLIDSRGMLKSVRDTMAEFDIVIETEDAESIVTVADAVSKIKAAKEKAN